MRIQNDLITTKIKFKHTKIHKYKREIQSRKEILIKHKGCKSNKKHRHWQ